MRIEIGPKDINDHIEMVLLLLKKQNYIPQATALSTHERNKLYKLLFSYNDYGGKECVFGEHYYLKTQEEIDAHNEKVFENTDDETRAIITKCGVNPKRIFSIEEGRCVIDSQLTRSMEAHAIAKVGDYTIEFTCGHPIARESNEIKSFCEDVQQEKYDRYKDGEASFRVFREVDGKKEQIYYHLEGMHFGDYIGFMDTQIGGNFGIGGYRISGSSGMMMMDVGISNNIDSLMSFFVNFEDLLFQQEIQIEEAVQTRLTIINSKIGTVRVIRNLNAICTGCWTLSATMSAAIMVVNGPTTLRGVVIGVNALCSGVFGLQWYWRQKELNGLREEKQEIQIEEAVQKKLTK